MNSRMAIVPVGYFYGDRISSHRIIIIADSDMSFQFNFLLEAESENSGSSALSGKPC